MNEGKFVDDHIVNKLMKNVIFDPQKKNKLIFDGYPRTLDQAKNLELLLSESNQKVDFIFFLNVNKDIIVERIEKRKIIEKRYDTYMLTTKPVLEYYSTKSNFKEIDGGLKIAEITSKINNILGV